MRLLKKMISALLVVCMVISVVPMAAMATETESVQPVEGRVLMDAAVLNGQTSVWIDGVEYAVLSSGASCYVDLPAGTDPSSMVTYSYHIGNAADVHTQYPIGMQVWALKKNADGSFTPEKIEELENILQYSGSSIRITGNKGIRMITSIEKSKKNALASDGLAGYKLLEYGTVLSWASDLEGGNPLVLGPEYAKSNYAYKKGEADPVFKNTGDLMQYTNVLVGFTLDQCAADIAMRPYMILEDENGQQMTIYGGIVQRSIGYIAWQNREVFKPGSAAYNYVWDIIRHVYAQVSFETNGGTAIETAFVQKGDTLKMPANPEREGYTFDGWYIDKAMTQAFDFTSVLNEDLTLYAKWNKIYVPGSDQVVLNVSNDEFIVGDSATVFFYAEVTGDMENIVLVDSVAGDVVLELKDDGKYADSGDDLPGDRIFSGKLMLDTSEEQDYLFHVIANDTMESNMVSISVIAEFTVEQLENMEQVDVTIQEDIFEVPGYDDMAIDELKNVANNVLHKLADDGLIIEETIYYDEESVAYTFMYECRALGAVYLGDYYGGVNGIGDDSEDDTTEDESEYPERTDTDFFRRGEDVVQTSTSNTVDTTAADSATVSVGDALILWSFNQKWDDPKYREPYYNTLEENWEENGLNTVIIWDTTVEDYKDLEGYEVIIFSGHGAYDTYTYKENLFAEKKKVTLSSLLLHEKSNKDKDKKYSADLKNFRVGKNSVKGGTMYAILPSFFTTYYSSGDLNGSFVFAENCEFYGKNGNVKYNMSNALDQISAEAVIGFHNSVMADYSRELMNAYVLGLISGRTAEEAFILAKNIWGKDDYYKGREQYGPTAYPIFSGGENAKLIEIGIKNGSFEEGNTAVYWDQVGDTRIIKQLGELTPQDGGSMAIITTGIGSAEDDYLSGTEGSILSQTFVVPSSQTTLTLSYDVVSEEPMEFVGTSYNDTFIIRIIHEDGTVEVLREDINTSTWYSIENINFDGGDDTMYHTLWNTVNVDLSKYAGDAVTIQFVVYDMGDSVYDTAVLIDKVFLH